MIVLFNLLGLTGAMTAGLFAWLIVLGWGLHGTEFAAFVTFFTASFGSVADRVPAGKALKAYGDAYENLVVPYEDPRVRISLLGIPLIVTPYVVLALAAIMTWLFTRLPPSSRFVVAMLISCGASFAVTLATSPIRSIRPLDS